MEDITARIADLERREFAQGGFAVLRRGLLCLQQGVQGDEVHIAVKFPNTRRIRSNDELLKLEERWRREIKAGQKVSHPNILPFLGCCKNPDDQYRELVGIVVPYCANGDAMKYILSNHRTMDDRLRVLCGTAAALFALHTSSPPVVHGDIKAANILVGDDGNALLTDFGLSRVCEIKGFTTESILGSLRWMAVELFTVDDRNRPHRTTIESDIWAFAMTILEILTSKRPFAEIPQDVIVFSSVLINKSRPNRPPFISDAIWTLLEYCWRKEPSARPDARHVGLVLDIIRGRSDILSSDAVSHILEGKFDMVIPSEQGAHIPESSSLAYKCKWLRCPRSFADMDYCIAHECTEFEARCRIAKLL